MGSLMRALPLLAVSALTFTNLAIAEDQVAARVRATIEQAMATRGLGPLTGPGCAFSVTSADQLLFAAGYGAANIEHGVPFQPETVSESGSVAKQFMAAAILVLAEQGRLSLSDDIRKYLPEMPDYGETIRIHHLIHQTSGIREWSALAALRGYPRAYRKIYTLNELLELVAAQRALNFSPGTRYEYSNSNYGLLTVILERVSGMSTQDFSEKHLFSPLGMRATQWRDNHRRLVPRRATAYRRTANGFEQAMPLEDVYGHGALLTTVADLQRWNHALLNGKLSPFVTQQLSEPGKLRNGEQRDYGGGLRLDAYRGHAAYRHAGNTAGYNAQLWAFPKERISIAFLCNASPGESGELAASIADAALGLKPTPHAEPGRSAAHGAPAAMTPTYFYSTSGEIVAIKSHGKRTFVHPFTRSGFIEMTPRESSDVMTANLPNYGALELRFVDRDHVEVSLEKREATSFARMPTLLASIAIEGRYESRDLDAVYEIKRRGDEYRMVLADRHADPIDFRLERLNGDVYLARAETKGGYLRDDVVVTFTRNGFTISAVAGLQGVDLLAFTRTTAVACPSE